MINRILKYKNGGPGPKKSPTGYTSTTRTWSATDNKTVSETMSRPIRMPAKSLTSSTAGELRATTDKDRANLKHYRALQLRETASPSGQLATWADNKLKHWEHTMGSVPGESLLATPMRMLSSVGHSANRFSKALSGDDPVYNTLAGTGNYAMASLDGLMLDQGIGAAGSKLSTAAIKNATKNTYRLNPLANKLNNPNTSYRVAGMDALEDFNSSGVLRSKPLANAMEGEINVGNRPTAFPSFNKGSADLRYLPEEGGVVFETNLPTFKRGEINPVTGQPIKGRHYAHRVIGETGEAVSSIPAKDITVREATPHWLRGYRKLDANGKPINVNYKLVRDKDKMMSGPIPTFSWKPYESSADDIISTQNMDTRLQAMYKKSRDAAFNANNYDYNEQTFLNENKGALQIHRANVAPGRSIYTLNPDDAEFANEFGNKKSLSELQQSLYNDYKNNTNFSNKDASLGQSSPSSLSLEERLKAKEFMKEYLEQLNSGVGRRQLESFDGMFQTNNLKNLQDNARYPIKLTEEIGDSYGSYTAFGNAKSGLNRPDQILNVLRVRPGISTEDLKTVVQHELGHNLQYNLPTLRGFGENSHANNANILDLSNSIFDPTTYHGLPQELSTWGNTIKNVGVNHNILKSTFDKVSPKQYGEIMETGDPWIKNFKKSMLPRREENHRFLLNFAY